MRNRSTRTAMLACLVDGDPIASTALIDDPERNFMRIMKEGVVCRKML